MAEVCGKIVANCGIGRMGGSVWWDSCRGEGGSTGEVKFEAGGSEVGKKEAVFYFFNRLCLFITREGVHKRGGLAPSERRSQ